MPLKLSPKAQASLDNVVARFKAGNLGPVYLKAILTRDPADDCPMAKWSFRNQVLAYLQSGDMDCRGYKQWQEVGRQVVEKGAAYILAPCTVYKREGKGKKAPFARGPDGEKVVAFTYYRAIPVFGVSKTEGEPLPEFDYSPAQLPPLADVAKAMGIDATYTPLPPDRYGDANPDGSAVRLGTHSPATWFHELAHAVHAKIEGGLKGGQVASQEIAAEFVATVLMDLYGYDDHTGNGWNYIKGYAKDPISAIGKALGVVEQILGALAV